jgi:methylase of polypeptide subunit release factors
VVSVSWIVETSIGSTAFLLSAGACHAATCGSGTVGAALAAAVEDVELHAVDIDPAAVACARRNLIARGGRVYEGDLYAPLSAWLHGRVDVLVANAPYVPTREVSAGWPGRR